MDAGRGAREAGFESLMHGQVQHQYSRTVTPPGIDRVQPCVDRRGEGGNGENSRGPGGLPCLRGPSLSPRGGRRISPSAPLETIDTRLIKIV